MGQSTKAVCQLMLLATPFVALSAWTSSATGTVWFFRISSLIVFVGAATLLLRLRYRKDLAPDYLRAKFGNYFNRDGFCFVVDASERDGACWLNVHFQNQYDRSCRAWVALRPAKSKSSRPEEELISIEINCGRGAFGVASYPVAVPNELQGQPGLYDVGASVYYDEGKRKRLRFFDGQLFRTNANFRNAAANAMTVAGAVGGAIVFSMPDRVNVTYPDNLANIIDDDMGVQVTTNWQLGGPPLESANAASA